MNDLLSAFINACAEDCVNARPVKLIPPCLMCGKPSTLSYPAPWGSNRFCSEDCVTRHGEEAEERDAERFHGA